MGLLIKKEIIFKSFIKRGKDEQKYDLCKVVLIKISSRIVLDKRMGNLDFKTEEFEYISTSLDE